MVAYDQSIPIELVEWFTEYSGPERPLFRKATRKGSAGIDAWAALDLLPSRRGSVGYSANLLNIISHVPPSR